MGHGTWDMGHGRGGEERLSLSIHPELRVPGVGDDGPCLALGIYVVCL